MALFLASERLSWEKQFYAGWRKIELISWLPQVIAPSSYRHGTATNSAYRSVARHRIRENKKLSGGSRKVNMPATIRGRACPHYGSRQQARSRKVVQ